MTDAEIRALEQAFYAAWPAAEEQSLNGWRLRFSHGVSRRANSVFALDWGGQNINKDVEADISAVEQAYCAKDLKPAFYLPPNGQPADLENHLITRGYHAEGHVHVQTMNLLRASEPPHTELEFALTKAPSQPWRACYLHHSPGSQDLAGRIEIMSRVTEDRAFLLATEEHDLAGCGMAVIVGDWVLIQGMRTVEHHRGQGVGSALVAQIFLWATTKGVKKAALQVEIDNPAALRLYQKAGFTTAYEYHYRILG